MRAAVERHNDDGSVDVLVAVRMKVTNSDPPIRNRATGCGCRWRTTRTPGKYKIDKLEQVTS